MGSGFKDWTAGDVLTAADVDGYLMRQTVMTFADASARDTALSGVLDEGMVAYLEDVNALTVYNGSAWVAVIDSDVLTVDTTNDRVGINDSTPSYALDVTGDINATGDLRVGGTAIGAWQDFPAGKGFTNITEGNGTLVQRYCEVNDLVLFFAFFQLGSTSALTGGTFFVPSNLTDSTVAQAFSATLRDGNTPYAAMVRGQFADRCLIRALSTGGSYVSEAVISSTVPFTWASGDRIAISGIYEKA